MGQNEPPQTSSIFRFKDRDEARTAYRRLLDETRRSVLIFAPQLDPNILDEQDWVEALSARARASRQPFARFLVHDLSPVMSRGHRLIELLQRLPSKLQLRRLPEPLQDRQDSFAVADERILLMRERHETPNGWLDTDRLGEARRIHRQFDELWEQAEVDPNLRRLHL